MGHRFQTALSGRPFQLRRAAAPGGDPPGGRGAGPDRRDVARPARRRGRERAGRDPQLLLCGRGGFPSAAEPPGGEGRLLPRRGRFRPHGRARPVPQRYPAENLYRAERSRHQGCGLFLRRYLQKCRPRRGLSGDSRPPLSLCHRGQCLQPALVCGAADPSGKRFCIN